MKSLSLGGVEDFPSLEGAAQELKTPQPVSAKRLEKIGAQAFA